MQKKPRCQSCGMPLETGFYGTNADGSHNFDYCKYCFKNSQFTEPNLTYHEMVKRSMDHMMHVLHKPHGEARRLAHSVIPRLKRWKHKHKLRSLSDLMKL